MRGERNWFGINVQWQTLVLPVSQSVSKSASRASVIDSRQSINKPISSAIGWVVRQKDMEVLLSELYSNAGNVSTTA
jgi:hypothetical protein